ncbi:hypothetical protein QBC41DRAFT_258140 [Cercophora samala]|uniref:Uncharacterized protein n=1 Tax=Cercophora samala TaxID=330535 RepID=A0AA39Z7B3_9PEZI|nr:hypothetical protein QBC41DRAFT_258140 [Cercophora samala]
MLVLMILYLPCLVGLALAGQVDPPNQAHPMAPGRILDTLISGVDCYKLLDVVKESTGSAVISAPGGYEGVTWDHKSCHANLHTALQWGESYPIDLQDLLLQSAAFLFWKGNIDNGFQDGLLVDLHKVDDAGAHVVFGFIKDAKDDTANQDSTPAASVDPNETCYNATSFPPLVQDDCRLSFDAWVKSTCDYYPHPNNMTLVPHQMWSIYFADKTCQFVIYNNQAESIQVNASNVKIEIEKHVFDPCISNGWYGGWKQDNNNSLALDLDTEGLMGWFIPTDLFTALTLTFPQWWAYVDPEPTQSGEPPQALQAPQIINMTLGGKWNVSVATNMGVSEFAGSTGCDGKEME